MLKLSKVICIVCKLVMSARPSFTGGSYPGICNPCMQKKVIELIK